jgi:DNA-binding SARP family transcriptional activator
VPAALTFSVLGPLQVTGPDATPLDLGGRQPRLVLSRLLLADGAVVSVDALYEAVWGDDLPETAAGTLQTYVSRLRRLVGPERLLREPAGYRLLARRDEVDAARFEQGADDGARLLAEGRAAEAVAALRAALGLWRGEVLGDLDAPFARPDAGRWAERRLAAQEDLFEGRLRLGEHGPLAGELAAAVQRWPLRERLRGLLALALYRSGRQAEALAALEEGRRALSEELGLDQSRELRELQARILSQDPSLDLAPPVPVVPTQRTTGDVLGEVVLERPTEDLIGRAAELRAALLTLDEALAGSCRYLVLEGEPGMGKTRLAQELLRRAEPRGALTLSAGTLEIGASPAYGPWLQIVRAAAARGVALPGAAAKLREGGVPGGPGASPATVAAAVADGVAETASLLAAQGGLVLVLDDLQWADPASLELLALLGPRLTASRVLLVVTVRHLEVGRDDDVVTTLAQITRYAGTRRLTLRGLSLEESGELLRRAAGVDVPDATVAALHARSEGNPFFTTELARLIVEGGRLDAGAASAAGVPTGIRDVLQQRVSRLPGGAQRALEVAAVVGRQVDLALAATAADRPLDAYLEDLEPALLARLLEIPQSAPGSVRFTHALVREALVEGLSPLRRARLHLRAADGILAAVGDDDDVAEVVAEHLWQAASVGVGSRAARALERAAAVALRRQAFVSAHSLLQRAASLHRAAGTDGGRAELEVLRQLGFVEASLSGFSAHADSPLVRRGRELARATERPDVLLEVIWGEWAACDTGGLPDRAEQLVREAESLAASSDDPLVLGGAASMRGFTERHFGRMGSSYRNVARAVELLDAAGPPAHGGFFLNGHLTSRGFLQWARTLVEGLDRAALDEEYAAQETSFGRIVMGLFGAASCMAAGDDDGLRLYAARMREADPDHQLSFWSSSADVYTAVSLLRDGDLEAGLPLLAQGKERMRDTGARTMMAGAFSSAAEALAAAGALDEARRVLADAQHVLVEGGERAYEPTVVLAEAAVLRAEGHVGPAQEAYDRALRLAVAQESHALADRVRRQAAGLTS